MAQNIKGMGTDNRRSREELDRDVEFSYAIKAGKRIYYMDVRRTRKDDMYLSITESKKIVPADGDGSAPSFEKHKIFLYREDFSKFIDGLSKAIGFIHENQPLWQDGSEEATASTVPTEDASESQNNDEGSQGDNTLLEDLKIDF